MRRTGVTPKPLAIHGGTPVRDTPLPLRASPNRGTGTSKEVVRVLRSSWITTGPKLAEFEEAVAGYVGAGYAVAFSSGTAALHGAAFAAGLGPDDEAITTPFTFCATANCVLYVGATPVFADVSSDTLNMDHQEMASHITSRNKGGPARGLCRPPS